ncbi:MAG: TonB-dependent receptor [Salinibacter sp.]|uniref:TonB-dependent receptor n=1 Tax=Salinibacter sp. TaxID=2065818 RepID=UPI0035D47D1C
MKTPHYRLLYFLFAFLAFTLITPLRGYAQSTGVVQGRVVDAANGTPLPGANVVVNGTSIGTSTGQNGRYQLQNVPTGPQTLTVSFVSYQDTSRTIGIEADAPTTLNFELQSQVLKGGEVVVTGLRKGQLRAINQKRQSMAMMDVLSADAIGKLPDQNVAEAVQRLPGISIETDRGEGRFVRIRGTAPELNNVTLNGQTMASTTESRATALDLLPSSMISSAEVIKAVTPDMDANAVGGTVNINTLTAFDRKNSFLFGTVNGLMRQQVVSYGDSKLPFRASVTGGTKLGAADQLGIVLSASASRRDFGASILDPDGWNQVNSRFIPEELEAQIEDNERKRYGGNLNLDYRPTESTSLYLRSLVTHTEEIRKNSEYEFGFEGDVTNQSANTGRYPAGSAELDLSYSDDDETLYSFNLGGEQQFGDVIWNVDGTYTRGYFHYSGPDATFETDEADQNMLSATYDTGPYFFKINPDNPSFVQNPANYPIRSVDVQDQTNTEDTYIASTDLRRNLRMGDVTGYLKMGGKFQLRNKIVDRAESQYLPTPAAPTLETFFVPATNTAQPNSPTFVHGNVEAFSNYVDENVTDDQLFSLDVEETTIEQVIEDSDSQEGIYAGYGMASVTLGPLNALGGVRVERTETEVIRNELQADDNITEDDISEETFVNSYTNVLPSLHLRYNATEDLIFRAAWSNTIGRPDYDLLAAFEEVSTDGTTQISITRGNPDLVPYRATSLDAFVEYYLPMGGLISVGGFYKHIDNPIYQDEQEYTNFTYEGVTYDEATVEQTVNVDAGRLLGAEATLNALFTFLPSPLDGVGLSSNIAVVNSEVKVPGREGDLPFFGQSDLVTNLAPYFQKWGVQARVAWSYQSAALAELEAPGNDRYDAPYSTIDASLSYDVPLQFAKTDLTIMGKVRNITNEAEARYQGDPSRYDRHVIYGRTFSISVSTNF